MRIHISMLPVLLLLCSCANNKNQESKEQIPDSVLWEKYIALDFKTLNDSTYYTRGQKFTDAETAKDTSIIHAFQQCCSDSINWIRDGNNYTSQELFAHFHTIDLDGDGKADIAYEGPSGGEPELVEMYLTDSAGFKKVFSGFQNITSLTFSNTKLTAFTLANPGCCSDPQIVEYAYSVNFDNHTPLFKLEKTTGYLRLTELPEQKFTNALPFTIVKDSAKLRGQGYIFEDVEHPVWGSDGNIIGLYDKGCKGVAMGAKEDSTGNWLFVLMDEKSKPRKCVFTTFTEQPCFIYGWLKKEETAPVPE